MTTLWMQQLGLTLCLFGAAFLPIVEIRSKKEIIAESGTYVEGNPYVKRMLTQKNFIAILSTILLVLGFIFQIIGLA
jgi:hypothetical protein